MHTDYVNPAIRQLRDQQVRFAPREKRIEQVAQAERLLGELDPARTYPYEYICYRVTNYRPESYPDLKLSGQEATHDLRLFVEDVSESADVPAEAAGERVLTVEELAKQFNVSTKTISRWRRQGLVSRRFVLDGRKRVGFLQSSVDRFVEQNQERVRRGSQFSQLTDEERAMIIERARRLARAGGCPADVTKRLARKTGRSTETIRYTLKQFDHDHPEAAVFPDSHGPLQQDTKRKIYQQYQRGESVEVLAKRFCRTRTSIYRIIAEMRAQRIMELPLDYIPNDVFARVRSQKAEDRVLGPMPESEVPLKKSRLPSGLPPYLASLYEVPLLTRKQEAHLFRKMNYLKYKAGRLRAKLDPARPRRSLMDQIERLYDEAVATKNQIIRANLRLVVSIAKRHVGPDAELLRAGQRREHVADAGGGEVRLRAGQQVQHLRQLGDHEELRPHHPRRAPPPRSLPHQPRGDVQHHRGRADRPVRAGNGADPARGAGRKDPGPPRRARAEDHHPAVRPAARPGAADAQAGRAPSWASPRSGSGRSRPGL